MVIIKSNQYKENLQMSCRQGGSVWEKGTEEHPWFNVNLGDSVFPVSLLFKTVLRLGHSGVS